MSDKNWARWELKQVIEILDQFHWWAFSKSNANGTTWNTPPSISFRAISHFISYSELKSSFSWMRILIYFQQRNEDFENNIVVPSSSFISNIVMPKYKNIDTPGYRSDET